jgi:hypothetical protein
VFPALTTSPFNLLVRIIGRLVGVTPAILPIGDERSLPLLKIKALGDDIFGIRFGRVQNRPAIIFNCV